MKPARWKQVFDLFQSAVERAPVERAGFLDEACYGNEGLRREVESLLKSHELAENFIELPAFEVAPGFVTNVRPGALVLSPTDLTLFLLSATPTAMAAHRVAFKGVGRVIAHPPCGHRLPDDAVITDVSVIKCQITAAVGANSRQHTLIVC